MGKPGIRAGELLLVCHSQLQFADYAKTSDLVGFTFELNIGRVAHFHTGINGNEHAFRIVGHTRRLRNRFIRGQLVQGKMLTTRSSEFDLRRRWTALDKRACRKGRARPGLERFPGL
jgi:hypothetical protein